MVMKTIERLCKYKDVADLIYREVHALLTKDLITEYKVLSKMRFIIIDDDSDSDSDDSETYPAFYGSLGENAEFPCFNWRTVFTGNRLIYHVSLQNCTLTKTGFMNKYSV